MKKQIMISLFLLPCLAFGYNWTLFGPEGIKANDVCFNAGSAGYQVISTSTGICICNISGTSWNTYSVGELPVWEVVPFDNENILLATGNGSFSDGIYKFNLVTHEFTVMVFLASPTFIKFCATNQTYYAGSRYDGLFASTNGNDWNAVPFFNSRPVTSMDFYNNHFVTSNGYAFQANYWSADTGNTWQPGDGYFLHYVAFHPNGTLYGIIPYSNSASLRVSHDYGNTFSLSTWMDDISTVGFDAVGNVLIGLRKTIGEYEGIARYDTALSTLTFLNEGLPNRFINKIRVNPAYSSITIFCCTDNGIYFSNDYLSGGSELTEPGDAMVRSYPNPCTSAATLEVFLPGFYGKTVNMSIYDITGSLLSEISCPFNEAVKNKISIDVTRLPAGILYCRLSAGKYNLIKKLAIAP